MSRWYGKIGFGVEVDRGYGNWELDIVERPYFGDLNRSYQRHSSGSESTIEQVTLNNELSIVSDEYSLANISAILYAEIDGTNWRVLGIEEHYPRLIMSLGGAYK